MSLSQLLLHRCVNYGIVIGINIGCVFQGIIINSPVYTPSPFHTHHLSPYSIHLPHLQNPLPLHHGLPPSPHIHLQVGICAVPRFGILWCLLPGFRLNVMRSPLLQFLVPGAITSVPAAELLTVTELFLIGEQWCWSLLLRKRPPIKTSADPQIYAPFCCPCAVLGCICCGVFCECSADHTGG